MADPQARLDELIAKLKERGHRLTPQRMAVLKILVASEEHPSAEQIYDQVKIDYPMISLATIYKTVAMLKQIGEVLELGFSDASNRYDARKDPHPHLVCIKCRSIIDLDVDVLNRLPQEVAQNTGYRLVSHRLDFYGLCPQCQEEE